MTPPRRWVRLDVTWEESGWLDTLSGEAAGCWPRLLCMVKRDGVTGSCKAPNLDVLARKWRVSVMAITALLDAAVRDGALKISGSEWVVSNWGTYQEPDRTRNERQARFKEKQRRKNAVTPRYPPVSRRATETLTLTETETSKPLGSSGDDPAFEEAWKAYPRRQGGNPKKLALQAWRARIREGIPAGDLVAAVHRYRAHVEATERMGTEFVLQAATFFGPKERWKDDFGTVKPNGNGNGRYRTSGEEWARNPGLIRHE